MKDPGEVGAIEGIRFIESQPKKKEALGLLCGLVEAEKERPSKCHIAERKKAIAESEFIKNLNRGVKPK